jgi:hypothetical protein
MDSCGSDVCGAEVHAPEIVIDSRRKRPDVSVAKMSAHDGDGEQLHFVARCSCRKVILKSRKIDLRIRRDVGASRCEKRLPLSVVHRGKNLRRQRVLKRHRNIGQRRDERLENEREASGDIILERLADRNAGIVFKINKECLRGLRAAK